MLGTLAGVLAIRRNAYETWGLSRVDISPLPVVTALSTHRRSSVSPTFIDYQPQCQALKIPRLREPSPVDTGEQC